jgi:hypothetical protein
MPRAEAECTVSVTIHHKIIVSSTATSVGFVIFVYLTSLHSQVVSILILNVLSCEDFIEPEVKVDKLLETITVTVNRSVGINSINFMDILIAR